MFYFTCNHGVVLKCHALIASESTPTPECLPNSMFINAICVYFLQGQVPGSPSGARVLFTRAF